MVNWYLVADESGVTVVDSGLTGFHDQLEPGLDLLGRSLDDVRAVVLTHGDADHTGVASKLAKERPEIPVYLNPEDEYLVHGANKKTEDPMRNALLKPGGWRIATHFLRHGGIGPPKIERTVPLADGETVEVPGRPRVIHTPGHTEGHVAFHFPAHGALFAGDSICTWHPIMGRRGPQLMAFNVSNGGALDSLTRYEDVEADLVLVGHGEPWAEGPAAAVEAARARSAGLEPVG